MLIQFFSFLRQDAQEKALFARPGTYLGESEVAKMLKELRGSGSNAPCVRLVSDAYTRESLYEISEAGKQELENWILAYYTHASATFPVSSDTVSDSG